jgi:hypothetical protein
MYQLRELWGWPYDGAFSGTAVHWHVDAQIFEMPMPEDGGEFVDPRLLSRDLDRLALETDTGRTTDDPAAPGAAATALGLLPGGQATCSLGLGNLAIGSDGQVLFSQFFAEQTALEFGRNGCEDVVSYPPEAEGTASK